MAARCTRAGSARLRRRMAFSRAALTSTCVRRGNMDSRRARDGDADGEGDGEGERDAELRRCWLLGDRDAMRLWAAPAPLLLLLMLLFMLRLLCRCDFGDSDAGRFCGASLSDAARPTPGCC